MRYCTHIWYEDWKCSECCQGDRCNYYVIVSKGSEVGFVMYIHGVIHKSVKHLKNSQQMGYATDHGNSYIDRERNC